MKKNEAEISDFVVAKKAPSPQKKYLSAYLCRCDLPNGVREFF